VLFGTAEAVPFPVLLGGQSPRRSRIFYAALNAQREIVAHRRKAGVQRRAIVPNITAGFSP